MTVLTLVIVPAAPPALRAADAAGDRVSLVAGEQSAVPAPQDEQAAGSSLRIRLDGPAAAPVAEVRRQPQPDLAPVSASVSGPIKLPAPPKAVFSHTKWQGPAATTSAAAAFTNPSRESDLQWKGAFQTVRRSSLPVDPGVVQVSAVQASEEPGTIRPVMLPTPPRMRPAENPELLAPARPDESNPTEPLERQLGAPPNLKPEKCLAPHDLKSIRAITADIGVKPDDLTGGKRLPPECPLGDAPFRPRRWKNVTFAWTAADTSHNPLYFEDEQLERYGNCFGPVTQATVSAVRFFAAAPLVPYFMGVYPPNENIYDLGQYRPGSCAPFYLDPLPLSVRGTLYEGMFLGLLPAL